ncbi:MAG: DUF1653 domain-containing protein [Clostridia bacterium]|nr:DUF1653 domain-containing protein [Clostridia bacterium]
MREIGIGKVYRHFKGKYYMVKNIAFNCESQEEVVIYRAMIISQIKNIDFKEREYSIKN